MGEGRPRRCDCRQHGRHKPLPQNADALYNRGVAYAYDGKYDKAIADYDVAARLDPKNAAIRYSCGVAYASKGEHDKALADYDTALKISPHTFPYLEGRAALRIRRGDYDGGIADLHAAITLDPNDPAAKLGPTLTMPLNSEEVEHGKKQVRQLLKDRPAMTKYGEKAKVLYDWAAGSFPARTWAK